MLILSFFMHFFPLTIKPAGITKVAIPIFCILVIFNAPPNLKKNRANIHKRLNLTDFFYLLALAE